MIIKKPFVIGAIILASANIITRLLGFAYRIFMSNSIGASGMGLYQLIMPIYSLAWAISCSGITTSLSRLVASENAQNNKKNIKILLKISLILTIGISLFLSIILFIFADYIGNNILNDERATLPLKVLSFSLVFMAAGSCIRGYFLGLQKNLTPAISQILEQFIRMGIIFIFATQFAERGAEYAVYIAVIGIVFGEGISFAYVFISLKLNIKKLIIIPKMPVLNNKQALFALISISAPLTLNRISGSFLSTIENLLIPNRLQAYGLSQNDAIEIFGKITGMALPLIFFPSAILTALSISLIPSISEAISINNFKKIDNVISKSIEFTLIAAFGAAIIFTVFPYEIGRIVYNQNLESMLIILSIICPFWYINITLSGILNGLGEQMFIFKNSLFASVLTIGFIYFLVPIYGIYSFLAGWFISLIIVTFLDIKKIKKKTNINISFLKHFVKPLLAASASGLVVNYIHNNYISQIFSLVASVSISLSMLAGLYLGFIFLLLKFK